MKRIFTLILIIFCFLQISIFGQGSETFTNIPTANSSSYQTRNWVGDNSISWTATDARTDQTINGKAILIRNGYLESQSTINGGIGSLTITTQRKFGTSAEDGNLTIFINGNSVGTVPFSGTVTTTTLNNINVSGPITVKATKEGNNFRCAIDDLTWTSYSVSPNDSDSEVDGPALSSQPDPMLISSLADSDPEAVRVFDFDVYDYGTSDGFPTKMTQVTIQPGANNTANWLNTIAGAKLSKDGGTTFVTTGTPVITTGSIVFPITSGNLDIADNDAEMVSLYIYLKNSGLIDNGTLEFKVASSLHGFIADASGSQFATTIPGATSNDMLVDVIASELRYVQQTSNTEANLAMSPAVTIQTTDVNGNRDLDFNSSISVTSTGTLTGAPVVVAAVNGLATFSTLTHTIQGTGFTLNAERDGTADWDVTSSPFNITEQLASICYEEHFNDNVPAGWVNNGTANETNGSHSGLAPNCRILGVNTDITSPAINNPQYLQFFQDASSGGNGQTATIEYRIGNSGAWTALYSFAVNTTGGTQTVDLTNVNGVDLSLENDIKFKFISTFNTWYLDDVVVRGSCVLPIEIMKLNLIKKDNKSILTWTTSSETNNSHFLIEWSRDAKEWNEIGTVKGSGTTHEAKEYSYIHENPKAGINYYRLTQVDFDGRKETFPAKSVFFESNQRNFDIIPNLAFNNVKIEFEKPVENGRLHIYNIDGQLMQTYVLASGIDILRIDVSGLPAGQYIAKYIDGEDTINKKFIKQ